MAVNEFTQASSKKVSAVGNWSLGHKPTAAEDAVFQEGKEPEFNAVMVCRSLLVRKNVKMTGTVGPEIGNSEKPEGPAGAGVILAQESGVTWSTNLTIKLLSTYTASELSIALGPSWLGKENGSLQLMGSAKYGLAEDLKDDAALVLGGGSSSPTLITNNHEAVIANKTSLPSLSGDILFAGGTVTLSLGASIVKLGEWNTDGGTVTINAGTSTIVIADGVRGFFEGTRTYCNLTLEEGRPQIRTSFTINGTLALNRTNLFNEVIDIYLGTVAEETVEGKELQKITAPKTITLSKGAKITTNGEAGHHAKLKGFSEAERSKLVLEEDIEVKGVLDWEFIEAVGFKIYAPEAGSVTGCKNIVKEAKGGGESFAGPLLSTLGVASNLTGRKRAVGAIAQSLAVTGTTIGAKRAAGALSQTAAMAQSPTGRKRAGGQLANTVGIAPTFSGIKRASGFVLNTAALSAATSGIKRALGALSNPVALLATTGGRKVGRAGVVNQIALANGLAWTTRRFGGLLNRLGLRQGFLGGVPGAEPELGTVRLRDELASAVELTDDHAGQVALRDSATATVALTDSPHR